MGALFLLVQHLGLAPGRKVPSVQDGSSHSFLTKQLFMSMEEVWSLPSRHYLQFLKNFLEFSLTTQRVIVNYQLLLKFYLSFLNHNDNRNTGKGWKISAVSMYAAKTGSCQTILILLSFGYLSDCLELHKVKIPNVPGWSVCGTGVCKFCLTYSRGNPGLNCPALLLPRSEKTVSRDILEATW